MAKGSMGLEEYAGVHLAGTRACAGRVPRRASAAGHTVRVTMGATTRAEALDRCLVREERGEGLGLGDRRAAGKVIADIRRRRAAFAMHPGQPWGSCGQPGFVRLTR